MSTIGKAIPSGSRFYPAYCLIAFLVLAIPLSSCSLVDPTEDENELVLELDVELAPSQIMASDFTHGVIRPDGSIWTWGPNSEGTLGDGTLDTKNYPVRALNIRNAVSLDTDGGIAIAADADGNIFFWGNNFYYLEYPDTVVVVPKVISSLPGARSVKFSGNRVYILREDSTLWYFDHDHNAPTTFQRPSHYAHPSGICQVSEVYALSCDGTLIFLPEYPIDPINGGPIDGLNDVVQVASVWNRRTFVLKRDGTVWGWGQNWFGTLGDGTEQNRAVPDRVKNLNGIVAISSQFERNLALRYDGTLWYWGMVDATQETGITEPVRVDLRDVQSMYAGTTSLARTKDGTFWQFHAEDLKPQRLQFN